MIEKRHPALQSLFDAIDRAGPFASERDLQRFVDRHMREYNTRPQADLGGLSPDAMSQLLYGDWAATGALRLADDLAEEDVAGAPVFADARTLLAYVRDKGPLKETAARNLTRADVAALLPRLRIPARNSLDETFGPPVPVKNEGDVSWLPAVRHTLLFAGLLVRRKGLRLSARGRELLAPERSGELYALLFRTLFRKLDLRVFDLTDRHPGLQSTVAFSFYKLLTVAQDWTSQEALADVAWLADAKDPPTEFEATYEDFRHWSFRHRVLEPLVQFGLLEKRELPTEEQWRTRTEMRLAPLFARFMRFDFGATERRHSGAGRRP